MKHVRFWKRIWIGPTPRESRGIARRRLVTSAFLDLFETQSARPDVLGDADRSIVAVSYSASTFKGPRSGFLGIDNSTSARMQTIHHRSPRSSARHLWKFSTLRLTAGLPRGRLPLFDHFLVEKLGCNRRRFPSWMV